MTECDCDLPEWLQLWSCPTCDQQVTAIECECYDIMAAIDRFRSEHPHWVRRPTREGRGVTIGTQEALDREDEITRSNIVLLQLQGECR